MNVPTIEIQMAGVPITADGVLAFDTVWPDLEPSIRRFARRMTRAAIAASLKGLGGPYGRHCRTSLEEMADGETSRAVLSASMRALVCIFVDIATAIMEPRSLLAFQQGQNLSDSSRVAVGATAVRTA